MNVRQKIEHRLVGYYGSCVTDFDIYENAGRIFVYPKAIGLEAMHDSPFIYSTLVVDSEDGEILKDISKVFSGYATIHF